MSEFVKFRLTTNKKEGTWSMRGGRALKNGTLKNINYYPGSDSIFDEDNRNSAIKPRTVVFRYNDIITDPAVEIIVPVGDKNLIDYLTAHPFNGRFYKRHDEGQIAEEKLKTYDDIEKALDYVRKSDDVQVKATALAVLGFENFSYPIATLKTMLKEKALKEPSKIILEVESPNYQNKYLTGLAYASGIVKNNPTSTAVVWADSNGVIVSVAKGENPIDKMAEFLLNNSAESTTVIQEIGERLKKLSKTEFSEEELKEKLENLREQYTKKTKAEVPPRFRNDVAWLESKLQEQ